MEADIEELNQLQEAPRKPGAGGGGEVDGLKCFLSNLESLPEAQYSQPRIPNPVSRYLYLSIHLSIYLSVSSSLCYLCISPSP